MPQSERYLKRWVAAFILALLILSVISQGIVPDVIPHVRAVAAPGSAAISPSTAWGAFSGTSGDVEIDVNRPGIAVRVEIPSEFGGISGENDTHFIQSNIRNDYYYYNVVDERLHWTYNESDGPCFKPNFPLHDPNAPWCVEIWNFLNGTFHTFTPPKFIRFRGLTAPSLAGTYNFTLFVANQTNSIGYPDFVHAWNTTLFVPVSMSDDPASISGVICDGGVGGSRTVCPLEDTKGVAYAQNSSNGRIVARSFVNETTGRFNITGLAASSTGTTYQILASAGFNATYDVAYSVTAASSTVTVGPGGHTDIGAINLERAPQVCGQIEYYGRTGALQRSLSGNQILQMAGLKVLNVTVEAYNSTGEALVLISRNMTVSLDSTSGTDYFRLITGSGVKYVGTDPYGTEFAGLPPVSPGSYQDMSLNVSVSGYFQCSPPNSPFDSNNHCPASQPVPVPIYSPIPCNLNNPQVTVNMYMGSAISGTIQFWTTLNGVMESPHQAEVRAHGSLSIRTKVTDALFGGNVLIEAFDQSDHLRAVSVINGTNADGTTIYKNEVSIPFLLFGFSEYLNHTLSGGGPGPPWWTQSPDFAHDYGLPPSTEVGPYSIEVFIRGYELDTTTSISVGLGQIQPDVTLKMTEGGVFKVQVYSYDNRFGTRATQSQLPFLFLHLPIPVLARTYFYGPGGSGPGGSVGYVQCILKLGITQPDSLCSLGTGQPGSETDSFTVIFAGQNWSIREILFYEGTWPTHLIISSPSQYLVEPYTLGYVWQYSPVPQYPGALAVTLLIGNEIDITGPVFANLNLLGSIPENDYAIGEAFGGPGFAGAVPANVTTGATFLDFTIFGFGGMTNNGTFEGQGHFFYVGTDGTLHADYGLDNGTYTAQVPEFGFNRHFMQPVPLATVTFDGLFQEGGVVKSELAMAIVASSTLVTGDCSASNPSCDIVALSWVQVTASNSSFQSAPVPTLDGQYAGVGALNLPQGTYTINFSVAFYKPETIVLSVQWGGGPYPGSPPLPLCLISNPSCDPPTNKPTQPQRSGSLIAGVTIALKSVGASEVLENWDRPSTLVQGREWLV